MQKNILLTLMLALLLPSVAFGQGKRRAVIVGVASFEHGYASLEYTARDARRTANALEDLGYSVSLLAADADAGEVKYADVLTALKNAASKSAVGDTLLFFFAGHGSRRMDKDYLLLSDSDPDKFASTALALDTLSEIVAGSKATRRVFVIDACRSTSRADGKTGFDGGKLDKGFKDALDKLTQQPDASNDIQTAVLYACSPGETSKENIAERAGVFTQRFVDALQQPGRTAPLTLGGILGYVRAHMPATLEQNPLLVGSDALQIGSPVTRPRTETPPIEPQVQRPPSNLPKPTVLFDGRDLSAWTSYATRYDGRAKSANAWRVNNGILEVVAGAGDLVSKESYRDLQLHVEFNLAFMPRAGGEARSNSGVILNGEYEIQILDSVNNPTRFACGCGAIYGLRDPDQNVCRRPGEWQTYDITFRAPRLSASGQVLEKPRFTLIWNGVKVHDNVPIDRPNYPAPVAAQVYGTGQILLQEHGDPVQFRNIRVTPIQ